MSASAEGNLSVGHLAALIGPYYQIISGKGAIITENSPLNNFRAVLTGIKLWNLELCLILYS